MLRKIIERINKTIYNNWLRPQESLILTLEEMITNRLFLKRRYQKVIIMLLVLGTTIGGLIANTLINMISNFSIIPFITKLIVIIASCSLYVMLFKELKFLYKRFLELDQSIKYLNKKQ